MDIQTSTHSSRTNESELCVQTFYQLDIPLAGTWGGQLEQTGMIASGTECIDFHWRPRQRPSFADTQTKEPRPCGNFLNGTATTVCDETRIALDDSKRFIADCGYRYCGD